MATLAEQIQAVLQPTAAGGAWCGVNTLEADENTVFPYVVWTKVMSTVNNTLAGPSNLQNTRVQVDLYSDTAAGMEALTPIVLAAMAAGPWTSVQLSSQDTYEAPVRAWRRILDFSLWSTN